MPNKVENGRYWAVVAINGEKDEDALIGFDEVMETHFFQSGEEDEETGEPVLWLGFRWREYQSFRALRGAMDEYNVQILEWELQSRFGT